MKKVFLLATLIYSLIAVGSKAQNSPFLIWGPGLNGTTFQTAAIYSDATTGFLIEAPKNASDVRLPIAFGWRGGTPEGAPFMISSLGNVGIGTSSPSEKLSVKGKIRAQEVKVEMNGWSDFVFAKDYVLPTLQETEKHIKEKGHLPGIPSAAEVERNGIELGDMNKKLLQKIEELTLYLIEQDKKSKAQEAINVEMKSQIISLSKQIKQSKIKN